jgi:hypothetical protein
MGGSGESSGDHADAESLTDPVPFVVGGRAVDLGEVVLDAARRDDQQQPGGPGRCPEPVRAPAGQEDETARPGVEDLAAAADGQLAVQDVEAGTCTRPPLSPGPRSTRHGYPSGDSTTTPAAAGFN